MNREDKEKLKNSLIDWLSKVDDEATLAEVREVQASYETTQNFSPAQIDYIESRLRKSEQDKIAGRVHEQDKLDELFEKWRREA